MVWRISVADKWRLKDCEPKPSGVNYRGLGKMGELYGPQKNSREQPAADYFDKFYQSIKTITTSS